MHIVWRTSRFWNGLDTFSNWCLNTEIWFVAAIDSASIWKRSWVIFGFSFIKMRFVIGWNSAVCCVTARVRAWSADSSSPITVIVGLLGSRLNGCVRTFYMNKNYRPHLKLFWAQALIHKKPICSKKLDCLNLIKGAEISWDLFRFFTYPNNHWMDHYLGSRCAHLRRMLGCGRVVKVDHPNVLSIEDVLCQKHTSYTVWIILFNANCENPDLIFKIEKPEYSLSWSNDCNCRFWCNRKWNCTCWDISWGVLAIATLWWKWYPSRGWRQKINN